MMKMATLALGLLLAMSSPLWAKTDQLTLVTVPKPVPALSFTDAEGMPLGLDAFKGKVVVLDVWATWCEPCRAEFPSLDRLQARLGDLGLVVLPLSVDHKGIPAVTKFYEELSIAHLPKFVGGISETGKALGLRGVPTTLVIDRQGREVARIEGLAAWDSPQFVAILENLLKADAGNAVTR